MHLPPEEDEEDGESKLDVLHFHAAKCVLWVF